MASQDNPKATALLATVRDLHSEICSIAPGRPLNGEIILVIETNLEEIPSLACLPDDSRRELDNIGTALWNACGRGFSMELDRRENRKVLSRAKTIAFILIDAMAPNKVAGNIRGLKAALSAAHTCIENFQLRLALRILESGAQRLDALRRSGSAVDPSRLESFTVEYFTLRTQLAWLQRRPDIAEHLFSQVPLSNDSSNRHTVIRMCYRVGCFAISIQEVRQGVKWLNRAIEQMPYLPRENSIEEAEFQSLNLLLRHEISRAYLNIGTDEAKSRFEEHFAILKKEHAETLAVKFLDLDFLRDKADCGIEPKVAQFFEVLNAIIDSVEFTEQNFLAVLGYVKYSRCLSQELALKAFRSLIAHLPIENNVLVEKSFIRLVSFATSSEASNESRLACIRETAEALETRGMEMLHADAAHACLIFIWKHVSHEFRCGQYSNAGNWCQLALNTHLLRSCSEQNRLQVQKKIVLCALKDQNAILAREVFEQMSLHPCLNPGDPSALDNQIMYLKCRISIQEGCTLSNISDYMRDLRSETSVSDDYGKQLLSLCVLEAQLLEDPKDAIACIQALISRAKSEQTTDGKLDAMQFLFPIYLLADELGKGNSDAKNVSMMLDLLKLVLPAAQCDPAEDLFSDVQLEWICRASYNLSLGLLKALQTEVLQEALSLTEDFIFQLDRRLQVDKEVVERLLIRTTYLSVSWHALTIRSGICDNEEKRARYTAISEHISNVRGLHSRQNNNNLDIFRNFWALGFEAAIFNEDWIEVLRFFHYSLNHMNENMYAQFLECILTLEMPHEHRVYILQNIVCNLYNPTRSWASLNRRPFPFFLRTLFQLCLSAKNPDENVKPLPGRLPRAIKQHRQTYFEAAETVLAQAITTAADERYVSSDDHQQVHAQCDPATGRLPNSRCGQFLYPKEELVHLASVAFNQAVDFYSAERDAECQRWAEKAIRLAELVGDAEGNELATVFRGRLAGLL